MATIKFGIYEKAVKELLGEKYRIEMFVEGRDFVRHKIRVGTRVMFRNGILEELAAGKGSVQVATETPERSECQDEVVGVTERDGEAIVTQRYPNPRYVNTTVGRVFVGGKPVKLGQRIRVCEGKLVIRAVSYLG